MSSFQDWGVFHNNPEAEAHAMLNDKTQRKYVRNSFGLLSQVYRERKISKSWKTTSSVLSVLLINLWFELQFPLFYVLWEFNQQENSADCRVRINVICDLNIKTFKELTLTLYTLGWIGWTRWKGWICWIGWIGLVGWIRWIGWIGWIGWIEWIEWKGSGFYHLILSGLLNNYKKHPFRWNLTNEFTLINPKTFL